MNDAEAFYDLIDAIEDEELQALASWWLTGQLLRDLGVDVGVADGLPAG